MAKLTWRQLAETISNLSDESKDKQAFVLIGDDGQGRPINELCIIEQDIYTHKDDYEECALSKTWKNQKAMNLMSMTMNYPRQKERHICIAMSKAVNYNPKPFVITFKRPTKKTAFQKYIDKLIKEQ